MDATFNCAFDKPSPFQNLEMVRNRRLRGAEFAAELTGAIEEGIRLVISLQFHAEAGS